MFPRPHTSLLHYIIAVLIGLSCAAIFIAAAFFTGSSPDGDIIIRTPQIVLIFLGLALGFVLAGILFVSGRSSHQKFIEEQRLTKILRQKDSVKTKFLMFAAHNLRTPATVFRWTLNDFLETNQTSLSKDQRDSLHNMYAVSLTMLNLIEDFLDVSNLELHQFEISLKLEPLAHMKEVVHRVVQELTPIAKEKHVSIKTSLNIESENVLFLVDMGRIGRVIENLIENAVQYTLERGHISVSLEHKNGMITFTIEDNGIGIPEEEQKHIFQQFFRSSNAKKHKSTGSGIGLFLAQKLVEAHKGVLTFSSREGKGSTFSFSLPTIEKQQGHIEEVSKKI